MLTLDAILFGVLLPALVTGAGALTSRWGGGSKGAVLVALGYAAGHAGLLGWPPFPPREASQWLVLLGLAALVPALARSSFWLRWLLRIALAATALGTLLQPMIRNTWEPGTAALWLGTLGLLLLFQAFELDRLLPRLPVVTGWLALLVPAAGAAVALGLTGSLLFAQLGGVLSASLGGMLAASLFRDTPVPTWPPVILLFGLLLCGYFYSELPAASALLLLAAPFAVLAPESWLQRRDSLGANVLRVGAVTLPVAAAVLIAVRSSPPLESY